MTRSCAALAALAGLLLAGAVPTAAEPPPTTPPAAADAARLAKALRLAQTVQPREMVVEQTLAVLDRQAVDGLLAEPDIKHMEEEHPGIVAAMWLAAKPILAELLVKTLPDLWDGLAGVYAKHFTPAQLDQAILFFGGPTGQKFLVEMNRNADVRSMMHDAARPGSPGIGQQSYVATVSGAANAAAAAMTPAERADLMRFLATPTGRALQAAGPDATRVALEWMNREDPEMDARVEAAMVGAMTKFLEPGETPVPTPAEA